MSNLIITPKTKIHDLLEAFPQLENELITMAPQFKKLQNPILRKTVAKITSLNQAATIAGLNVEIMVNKLREIVGQNEVSFGENNVSYTIVCPNWFSEEMVMQTIDIREMLHAGEHPVHEVLSAIKQLDPNEILKIEAPFILAPLIDKTISLEYKHWIDKQSEEFVIIYFLKETSIK